MPESSPQHLRRVVLAALVTASGAAEPDRRQLARGFEQLCERFRAILNPMFGAEAVDALFARGLHVATTEFPWLAAVVPRGGERCSPEGLAALPVSLGNAALQDGLAVVLASEIALLSGLIGEEVVMPLVEKAWANPPRKSS